MLYPYMQTSYTLGRPSSPLNPHTSSSSPPSSSMSFSSGQLTSPTPPSTHKTRYKRPETKKYLHSAPAELFAEGTTPTEGQMWRERFTRRMVDRERRKKIREVEVDKRRGVIHEEQDEAKALEDDEEIFRRLMVLQRQREQRNAQISYEIDNGGSDPISPDFWDEDDGEGMDRDREESELQARLEMNQMYDSQAGPSNYQTPQRPRAQSTRHYLPIRTGDGNHDQEQEEDQWAAEAARAEEAEREAEEAELARQIEELYRYQDLSQHQHQHHYPENTNTSVEVEDIEMDWDVDMDL